METAKHGLMINDTEFCRPKEAG